MIGTPRVGRHPFGVAIDSARGIAVVANRNERTVSVVDLLSATTRGTISVGRGPIGVAIRASGIAFVTLAQENAVAVIDPALGTLIRKIASAIIRRVSPSAATSSSLLTEAVAASRSSMPST